MRNVLEMPLQKPSDIITKRRLMFTIAQSLWLHGLKEGKNIYAWFRTIFPRSEMQPVVLGLTGSTLYCVYLNGKFVQHEPARGSHGFYRVAVMEMLFVSGMSEQLLRDIKGCLLPMVQAGTFWGYCDVRVSCDHGFASYLCVVSSC
jgi:hypothetical protein